jgi:hypothetical protein
MTRNAQVYMQEQQFTCIKVRIIVGAHALLLAPLYLVASQLQGVCLLRVGACEEGCDDQVLHPCGARQRPCLRAHWVARKYNRFNIFLKCKRRITTVSGTIIYQARRTGNKRKLKELGE